MDIYYGWNTDDILLKESASGGFFSSLAVMTIKDGGVVFGAVLDCKTSKVSHIKADNLSVLPEILGSKYQQSNVGNVYKEAEAELKNHRNVLFSGTPCQIAALLKFLAVRKVNTQNLVTVEILCHGVTSTDVIKAYINSKEKIYGQKIKRYAFRTKDLPWYHSSSSMHLFFENGKDVYRNNAIDEFYVAFKNNLILRPSCYQCPFSKKEGRAADFTFGDFWGAEDYLKDKKALEQGVGLALINTEKGGIIWQELMEKGRIKADRLEFDLAAKRNPALVKPAKMNQKRDELFDRIRNEDFSRIIKDIYGKSIMKGHIQLLLGYDLYQRLKNLKSRWRR